MSTKENKLRRSIQFAAASLLYGPINNAISFLLT
jgi:hypothetical protein